MSSFRAALRLPGDVWRLELAVFVNFLGTGLVLPFELIYLHNLRGFSFALTGLIGAVMSGLGIFFTPLAGVLIDRLGPRALMIGSFTSMACGYALFPTIHAPWQGFLCAALIGVGNGTFRSGETALFITYVPREHRHLAFVTRRMLVNLGIGLGGIVAGLVVVSSSAATFTAIFLGDAASFVVVVALLAQVPPRPPLVESLDGEPVTKSYRLVFGDRTFCTFVALNTMLMVVGYGVAQSLGAVYAKNFAHASPHVVGLLITVNAFFIVVAQIPIGGRLERRRRMLVLATTGALWSAASLLFWSASFGFSFVTTVFLLLAAETVIALGECLHGAVATPLVADLVNPAFVGRYVAVSSLAFQAAMAIGPAAGGALLEWSAGALWLPAAAVAALASVAALRFERRLPAHARTSLAGLGQPV